LYDIGILTFWGVPNYGTFAQAYALQKVIAQLDPDRDVKQIAYLNRHHYNMYFSLRPRISIRKPQFWGALLRNVFTDTTQKQRRRQFFADYATVPHTKNLSKQALCKTKFDTVVLGSDIVWDYSIPAFDHDPFLFGNHMQAKKITAYAASFGTVVPDDPIPEYVSQGIRQMAHISVRDENSADIVEKICGRRPTVVLDPVWLWDFGSDENVVTPTMQDYIVVYGQDFTEDFIRQIVAYAKSKNLKLVCLDCNEDRYDWCDVLIRQQDLSAYEWLGLFKGASAVATSTFHGLTFGLVFDKKLAFCRTDFIMAKADKFLAELGLYDLYEHNSDVSVMFEFERDSERMHRVIQSGRQRSIDYLKQSLSEEAE
jgi:hypothetical protein